MGKRDWFTEQLSKAVKEVESWPKWKQEALAVAKPDPKNYKGTDWSEVG